MATQPSRYPTGPIEVSRAINAVIDAHQEAWNRHDVQAFLDLFTDDGELVNVVGTHRKGKQELGAEFAFLHTTMMKNSHVRMLERTVRQLAQGVVLAHITWDMTGVDSVPGWNVPEVRRGVLSYVIIEKGGKWLITSAHNTEVQPFPDPTKPE
jgi:uncharacterized protein (TIGR02246 family)